MVTSGNLFMVLRAAVIIAFAALVNPVTVRTAIAQNYPEMKSRFMAQGIDLVTSTPEEFRDTDPHRNSEVAQSG